MAALTTTVGLDGGATTRALTNTGVKTFAVGETMAVIYHNGTSTVKAVSHALEAGDITNEGKNATFTFDLETPNKSGSVLYIYPAAMAGETGVDITKLNTQEGTFDALQSKYDLCTNFGDWDGDNLPSLTLENLLAILAITLKDEAGENDITSGTTKLTVSDGTNTYNVNRDVAAGPIYVAILPTSGATIDVTATDGSKNYTKSLTNKTYEASKGYNVSWKMTQGANLSKLTDAYTAQNGDKLTGTLGGEYKISIAAGATVTLKDADINGSGTLSGDYAGITCVGSATIILEGDNTVKGFNASYPGIYVPVDKTLTIQGTGSLTASPFDGGTDDSYGAGIGGGYELPCGNIVINSGTITATGGCAAGIGGGANGSCGTITISGGTITATGGYKAAGIGDGWFGSCGNITINGGTITATGGKDAPGIGGGDHGTCGTITITSGVTEVTATKGSGATNSIGAGYGGSFGTVSIGGTVYWDGSAYKNGGDTYLTTSPLTYPAAP